MYTSYAFAPIMYSFFIVFFILFSSLNISYPGHVGIVKDATEATVRVELHSKCQTIIVDRGRVSAVGSTSVRATGSYTSNQTPQWGAQTPMYAAGTGSHTPMYSAQVWYHHRIWHY